MTDYGPEFATRMVRNNRQVSSEQLHFLIRAAMRLRKRDELVVDQPIGVNYNKALWRGFRAHDLLFVCGLVFPDKPHPTVHIQTIADEGFIAERSQKLFRIDTTVLRNKDWFYRNPKYVSDMYASRYKLGDDEPEEQVFYNESYPDMPPVEKRLWGLDFFTDHKFQHLPIVNGSSLTVERFCQLKLLLGTVMDLPVETSTLED